MEAAVNLSRTPPTRTAAVKDWNSDVREEAKTFHRGLADGFEEERVVVKVILDEPDVSLTLLSCALHHDIQSSLYGALRYY